MTFPRRTILAAAILSPLAALPLAGQEAKLAKGQVTKIDESAGKMTVKHGPIPSLEMDSMTMVFRVAEPAMLRSVKPGDRIEFDAARVNGAITITKLRKAR
jgi:Cu/Ag efflux protein CusF